MEAGAGMVVSRFVGCGLRDTDLTFNYAKTGVHGDPLDYANTAKWCAGDSPSAL